MPPKRSLPAGKTTNSPSKSKRSRLSNTSTTPRKRTKVQRSIWNSTDDWDTLISESQLSTSSISIRPPRLRELPTLVKCCSESIARGFKKLWDVSGDGTGAEFKAAWGFLPNHLKEGIRDSVFRYWGGFLTVKILAEVFLIPPHLYIPGELLPSISSAEHVKSLIPSPEQREQFTSLSLKHASKASDLGISAIIYNLPNLESINLKGCSLAGEKTIKQILGRCSGLKGLNMKGTKITEGEVKNLLDRFGKRLEVFKVDSVFFENINDTFSSQPYPSLTHLSLPGDFLNSPSKDYRHRSKILSQSFGGYPQPRQSHPENIIQWYSFHIHFPKLTHLYLPGLLIPEDTLINLSPGLIRLHLGAGGPPVPVEVLNHLLEKQMDTLRSLKLGHIKSTKLLSSGIPDSTPFTRLGKILSRCERLEEFSMKVDPGGSKDPMCEACMGRYSDLIFRDGLSGNWRKSLKKLSLVIPQSIDSSIFFPSDSHHEDERSVTSPLEQLELPSAIIDDTHTFALALQGFPKLRSLDLSGTTITDEDMEIILQGCKLLSRIDLTSCRGINVRHRRNIFRAYEHN
ncbi:hypothetical protein I203_102035 [Kwoniella mangroviensis CBS 8507]|uniref:uncharacterized protein n=1 Tax=Kwoniella mangroviensis CBS 8507 TaxID=1296122 RepID=UPI00080D23C0|nr:uncharacterized protein I203_03230 [Kwoniella mangroviensis CBS 8507]OCF67533.1 hypothetical protein I203_03230 [Kwoniella mangroviensis CBS 8507]